MENKDYMKFINIDEETEEKDFEFEDSIRNIDENELNNKFKTNTAEVVQIFQKLYELFSKYNENFYGLFDFINQPQNNEFFINPCTPYVSMYRFSELLNNKKEIKLVSYIKDNENKFLLDLSKENVYNLLQELCNDLDDIRNIRDEILHDIQDFWDDIPSIKNSKC